MYPCCLCGWGQPWNRFLHIRNLQADDEYMLSDVDLFVNRYISVPKDMGQLNCAAFIAGVLKGALQGAGFPARQDAILDGHQNDQA